MNEPLANYGETTYLNREVYQRVRIIIDFGTFLARQSLKNQLCKSKSVGVDYFSRGFFFLTFQLAFLPKHFCLFCSCIAPKVKGNYSPTEEAQLQNSSVAEYVALGPISPRSRRSSAWRYPSQIDWFKIATLKINNLSSRQHHIANYTLLPFAINSSGTTRVIFC